MRPFLEDMLDAFLICTPCFLVALLMDMAWSLSLSPKSVHVLEAAISLISLPAFFVLAACILLGQAISLLAGAVGSATGQTRKSGCLPRFAHGVAQSFARASQKFHLATAFLIGAITALVVVLIFGIWISGENFPDWPPLASGLINLFVLGSAQIFIRQWLLDKASSETTALGNCKLALFCIIMAVSTLIAANYTAKT